MSSGREDGEAFLSASRVLASADFEALGEVVEEINRCLAAGREPDLQALGARHPGQESRIEQLLETLRALHDLGRGNVGRTDQGEPSSPGVTSGGVLGDYRLLREIGRGGMGIVYEAEQVSLGRRVALKVLPFAAVLDQRQLLRFKNEALAAGQLHHTNIVPVYSVGCERGVHYYAMQYVDGQDLGSVLRELRQLTADRGERKRSAHEDQRTPSTDLRATLSPGSTARSQAYFRAVAQLILQAAGALEHAHEVGIIHRDIKPSNLLLDGRGKLWITDFGLARIEKDVGLTLSGDIVGTLQYMSPEQALGKRTPVDHRADVYSLGVTLYELVTFELPFAGKDRQEVLRRIAFEDPRPPRRIQRNLPAELETIILKALAKSPEERYATAGDFAEDLLRHLEDRPILARRPGLVRRAIKWSRRRKGLLSAIVTVLLSASVAGALLSRQYRQAREAEYENIVLKAAMRIRVGEGLRDRSLGQQIGLGHARDPVLLAESELLRAESLLPEAPSARFHRARALSLLSREVEALEELGRLPPDFQPGQALRVRLLASKTGRPPDREDRGEEELTRRSPWAEAWLSASHATEELRWKDAAEAHGRLLQQAHQGKESEIFLGSSLEARLGRGEALLLAEDHDRAIEELGAAAALWPELSEPVLLLGWAYLAEGRPEVAEEKFQSLAARETEPGEVALGIAGVYVEHHDYEKALTWVARSPETSEREAVTANILSQLGRSEEALERGRRAVRLDPSFALAHFQLGLLLVAIGKLEEAAAEFRKVNELAPRAEAHVNLANLLQTEGKLEEAVSEYREALRLEARLSDAHVGLGMTLAKQGKEREARKAVQTALDLKPREAERLFNLGAALQLLGELDRAIEQFGAAVSINPRSSKYQLWLGTALADRGRFEEAIPAIKQAIQLDPGNFEAREQLGQVFYRKGDHEAAVAGYRDAIQRAGDHATPQAFFNLGLALCALGRLEEGIAELKTSSGLDPSHAATHLYLGEAYRDLGQLDRATAEYRRAVALDPQDRLARNALAIASFEQGLLDESVAELCKALEIDPGFPEARDNLLEMLLEPFQPRSGIVELQGLVEGEGCADAGLLGLYGLFLARLGNPRAAVQAVGDALVLDPEDPLALAAEAHLRARAQESTHP